MFKRNLLQGILKEHSMTEADFAEYLEIPVSTLYSKYRNDGNFSRAHMAKIYKLVGDDNRFIEIFFSSELA